MIDNSSSRSNSANAWKPAGVFTQDQYKSIYPDGMREYFWNLARNKLIYEKIRRLKLSESSTVLEIGCGTGIVVDFLRSKGVDCWGVELGSPPIPDRICDYVMPNTSCFDLPSTQRDKVAGILLLDVLEHLPEPEAFLTEIHSAFPRARAIVVTVPARSELWSNYDEFNGHYRRYDRRSLASMIDNCGYLLTEIRYFFKLLYPIAWIHIKFKNRSVDMEPPKWLLIHRLASIYFYLEAICLPAFLVGTSLIATAEPRKGH